MVKAYAGQWCLVTGASSGIGAEFARQLAGRELLAEVSRRGIAVELLVNIAGLTELTLVAAKEMVQRGLLGVALHAAMSFAPFPWPVRDTERSNVLLLLIGAVHGFRMPLFFLLSGYFTMLVFSRRGLASLLEQRFTRIFLPLVIAAITIVPLDKAIDGYALRTKRPEAALTDMRPVGVDEVLAGRERLRAILPTGPNPEGTLGGPLDRATLAWSDLLSAEWLRLHLVSRSLHLVQTNVFNHLWFLWCLCWLVAAFAILATMGLVRATTRDGDGDALSYRYSVRYTAIGSLLNGPRSTSGIG